LLFKIPSFGFFICLFFDNLLGFIAVFVLLERLEVLAKGTDILVELAGVNHAFVVFSVDVFPIIREIFLAELAVHVVAGFVFHGLIIK
jgi:hypothetical protein